MKVYTSRPPRGNARKFWDHCVNGTARYRLNESTLKVFFSREHTDGPQWVGTDDGIEWGYDTRGATGHQKFVEAYACNLDAIAQCAKCGGQANG